MTLSTLICIKCNSAYYVSGRNIVLPYVCPDCKETQQEYEDMTPATCFCDDQTCQPPNRDTRDYCDTASVENTTALIADLELQLEAERRTILVREVRIAELEKEVKKSDNKLKDALVEFSGVIRIIETYRKSISERYAEMETRYGR
jgi:hypothetical protein